MRIFYGPCEIVEQRDFIIKKLREFGNKVNIDDWSHGKDDSILHFHSGQNIEDDLEAYQYAKNNKRVRFIHYWGHDVRRESIAIRHNPYVSLFNNFLNEQTIIDKLQLHSQYFSACIVSSPELYFYVKPYFRRVYLLPYGIENVVLDTQPSAKEKALIAYSNSQNNFIESSFIHYCLSKLKSEGYIFDFIELDCNSLLGDPSLLKDIDLWIDQIFLGWYTSSAVHAMAIGIPVISYIREDLKYRFPFYPPLISANPATLYETIKQFLANPNHYQQIRTEEATYIQHTHNIALVVQQLLNYYSMEKQVIYSKNTLWEKRKYLYFFKYKAMHIRQIGSMKRDRIKKGNFSISV